jgi:hypothetical protein
VNGYVDDYNGEDFGGDAANMDFLKKQEFYVSLGKEERSARAIDLRKTGKPLILTAENYFSPEAEAYYFGSTSFKRYLECEARGLAVSRGEWKEEETTALLVGSYVDAHFSRTLDLFKAQHPDIFKRDGSLKSEYEHANYIIQRIERDEMMMRYLSGGVQKIMTGEIEGVPFKIKIDSHHAGKCNVDQKIMKDFAPVWDENLRRKVPFVEAWGYDIQAAIYTEVERQNRGLTAEPLPFMIAGATKEKPEPDLAIILIPQERIDICLDTVREYAPRFQAVKQGREEPVRCEHCDYCRHTKKLTQIVDYREVSA